MDFLLDHIGFVLLFLTAGFIWFVKKYRKDDLALTSKYQESRHYQATYPDMLEAVNSAMVKAGFEEVSVSPRTTAFTARTGFSMSSFMEFIEVRCEQHGDRVVLNFLSICGLPTQIYAWGKNKRNARRFFQELDARLNAAPVG